MYKTDIKTCDMPNMRKLVSIMIVSFAGAVLVAGQTDVKTCPKALVTAERDTLVAGDSAHFVAMVDTDPSPDGYEFSWDVSLGPIVEGQGTPKIVVSTRADFGGRSVVATVNIKKVTNGCSTSSSATIQVITIENIDPDYYGRLDWHEIQALIDNYFVQLNIKSSHRLLLALEFDQTDSYKDKLLRVKAIVHAIRRRNFDATRVTLAIAKKPTKHEYRPYLVLRGARNPLDPNEFIFIECEKLLKNIKAAFPEKLTKPHEK